jgi:hypothetical protein
MPPPYQLKVDNIAASVSYDNQDLQALIEEILFIESTMAELLQQFNDNKILLFQKKKQLAQLWIQSGGNFN